MKGSMRPDPLRGENHYLIYNKHGKAEARIAPDPIRSNQYQIIDRNGNQTGRINHGIVLVVIDKEDLTFVADGGNFINLLRNKYEKVRLDLK